MQVKAVIFDMDGVIFDTEKLSFRAWREAEQKFNFIASDELLQKLMGASHFGVLDIYAGYFGDYETGKTIYDWRHERIDQIMQEEGLDLKEGVMEILDFLRAERIPFALATSNRRANVDHFMQLADLRDVFQFIVSEEDIRNGKPDPEIYLKAAALLGIPIQECLVVEDSFKGVLGGAAAGALTVMVPDMVQPTPEVRAKAYKVCDSLLDVIPLIEQLNRAG
ncbi:MAG: hypothetical protein PWQ55_2742 [Chloroflexota bacterium]|nr:hypothetical protein [Chloroflexota bacterium]